MATGVLEMIEGGLSGKDEVLCLKFNGWRFQGFEDAKIALIEGIVMGLVEKRPALTKAAGAVKDVFARIDWLKVAKNVGGPSVNCVHRHPDASPDRSKPLTFLAHRFLRAVMTNIGAIIKFMRNQCSA